MKPKHSWHYGTLYIMPFGAERYPQGGMMKEVTCRKCGVVKVYEWRNTRGNWVIWKRGHESLEQRKSMGYDRPPWPCVDPPVEKKEP